MFRWRMQDYWLPTPFASFPFTSPPVRHRVLSHSNSALQLYYFFNLSTRWDGQSWPRHYCFTRLKETWYPSYRRQVGLRAGLDRCTISHLHTAVRTEGRSARSKSLYRLSYPAIYFFFNKETALTCPKYITNERRIILCWIMTYQMELLHNTHHDISNAQIKGSCWRCLQFHTSCEQNETLHSSLFLAPENHFFLSVFHLHVHTFHFELHLCLPVQNHTPDLIII